MSGAPQNDYVAVFYYGSFLPVANGGGARLVDLLDRLHDEFERVILYCYSNHPQAPWTPNAEAAFRARWPGIELVLEPHRTLVKWATRLKNLAIALAPASASRIVAIELQSATPAFDSVKQRSGILLLSYFEALTQVNGIDPKRCLVETHDVNFVKWAKMHRQHPVSLTALRKLRSEIAALETVRTVLAISPVEFSFFRMVLARPAVSYVPRWAKPHAVRADAGRDGDYAQAEYDLVFVGSDYVMNVEGLCRLLQDHGHWLGRYRIAVCGRVCDHPQVRAAAAPFTNVVLFGFVDRVHEIYRRSRAALSPVDGTGTKMKVLAALSAGLPVFASAQSREGLPAGHDGAVFPISEADVAAVLDRESNRIAAAEAARLYHATLHDAGEADTVLALIRATVPTNKRPARRHVVA